MGAIRGTNILALAALLIALPVWPDPADSSGRAICNNSDESKKSSRCHCSGSKEIKVLLYNQGGPGVEGNAPMFVAGYFDDANKTLKKFGLKLNLNSQYDATPDDNPDKPIATKAKFCRIIGNAFKNNPPAGDGIPIFTLRYDVPTEEIAGAGEAIGLEFDPSVPSRCRDLVDVSQWPNFIVIKTNVTTRSNVVVHEIGHALDDISGKKSEAPALFAHRYDKDVSNIMSVSDVPNREDISMSPEQLAVFCSSKFTK